MIYTVTLNPAIDCAMDTGAVATGRVNRAASQNLRFSGKGINVSHVLKEFGGRSTLMGLIAGFTGDALETGLAADGFCCDFVKLSRGVTRINVKLTSSDAAGDPDTEINAPGPTPEEGDLAALTNKLASLRDGDAVVLAGSLPAGVSPDYVNTVAASLPEGVSFICDLSGEALRCSLVSKPDFVKPNIYELYELVGIPQTPENLADRILIKDSAEGLISMGAKSALITMGGDGAYYITPEGSGFIAAPPSSGITGVRSAVGCGDSTVAGWLIGMGFAGDDVRTSTLSLAGIDRSLGKAETAAKLAVILGSASYYGGFPASPKKLCSLCGT